MKKNSTADRRHKQHRNLEVYTYSFANSYVQLCDRERLLIGGGGDQGFGLALENDLFTGSSHPCDTFHSPSLSNLHADGSKFCIQNVEVWIVSPCLSMIENKSKGLTRVHSKKKRTDIRQNHQVTKTRT